MNITVSKINLSELNKSTVFYIGRYNKRHNLQGSALGNKFVIGKDGSREEVIQKYRKWLWQEVQKGIKGEDNKVWDELMALLKHFKSGKEINLMCYCKPLACHGDIVKSCLEWLATKGY